MAKPKAGKPHTHTRTHSRVTELRGHTHTTHTCPTLEDRLSRVDQPTGVGAVGCADICIDTVKFARSCCENRLFFREVIEFCLTSCCMSCFIISTLFLCCHKGVYCLALGRLERPREQTDLSDSLEACMRRAACGARVCPLKNFCLHWFIISMSGHLCQASPRSTNRE